MSREIKFRAWDIKNNRFVNIVRLVFDQFGALDYAEVVFKGKIYKLYPSEIVLEQDTGLKDKNGKMIMDGDIVKNIEGINETAVCVWDESNAEFDFRGKDGKYTRDNVKSWLEMYEVIGNIHEDTELLDDSIHGPYGPIGEENIGGESRRMKND